MFAIRAKNGRSFRRSGLVFSHEQWTLVKRPTDAMLDEPQLEVLKSVKEDDPRLAGIESAEANEDDIIRPEDIEESAANPAPSELAAGALTDEIRAAVRDAVAEALGAPSAQDSGDKAAGRGRPRLAKTDKAQEDSAPLHGTESDPGATPPNSQPGVPAVNEDPSSRVDMGPNISQLTPEQAAVQTGAPDASGGK